MTKEVTKNLKKDINNIHDKGYKDLYSNKEVFLDLVKGMLKAPWAHELLPENLALVEKSFISPEYEEQEADIVYSANIDGNEVIFYVLLEFQSTVDYRMPLRLFFYISQILATYAKNENYKRTDKNIRIPAVVPLVLYNGKTPWDVPTRFRHMIYNEEKFGDNIIDFKYDIFDVNNSYSKEELLSSKTMTAAIFLLDQKIDPHEFLQRIKSIALFFDGLTQKEIQVLKNWIRNTVEDKLAKQATEILEAKKEDVEKMVASNAFILTEMLEDAKNKKEIEIKIENAKNFLLLGVDVETVSKGTELPIEKIKSLKKELKLKDEK